MKNFVSWLRSYYQISQLNVYGLYRAVTVNALFNLGFALEGNSSIPLRLTATQGLERRQKAEGRRITLSFFLPFEDTSPVVYERKAFSGGVSSLQTSNLLPLCPKGFPDGLGAVSFRAAFVAKRLLPSFSGGLA